MDKYKHFFYNNLDLACFANLGGYFEELNENFTKVLGYSTSDLLDKPFFEFIHPGDVESTFKEIEQLATGYHTASFVNRFRTKTDEYRYLEWSFVVDLESKKIFAMARDVTDKMIASNELIFQCEENKKLVAELFIANKKFAFQNREKENRATELMIANEELAFQNAEKEKRAAELIIANKELAFQNTEKEKRAQELSVANIELAYQNAEKEKRAAELIVANEELAFQNTEKENRATELTIANEELAFQNEEKEKRAAELIIANQELAFQNTEKENRATELMIANKELIFQNKEKEKRATELVNARTSLKKTEGFLREYIIGLEEMLAMTSHGVRQPVASILGIIHLFDKAITSPGEQKKLMEYIKQSALALDAFTKRLTIFMYNLGKQSDNRIHSLH